MNTLAAAVADASAAVALEARAWTALAAVEDPEIPVLSIVDLGVIRHVRAGAGGVTRKNTFASGRDHSGFLCCEEPQRHFDHPVFARGLGLQPDRLTRQGIEQRAS